MIIKETNATNRVIILTLLEKKEKSVILPDKRLIILNTINGNKAAKAKMAKL